MPTLTPSRDVATPASRPPSALEAIGQGELDVGTVARTFDPFGASLHASTRAVLRGRDDRPRRHRPDAGVRVRSGRRPGDAVAVREPLAGLVLQPSRL